MSDQTLSGIDRRTVVRAGVATAWAVPVVQAVVAAPAFAVSGPANLSSTTGAVTRSGNSANYSVNVTVRNSGGSATQGLSVALTFSTATTLASVSSAPAGWTRQGTSNTWTANAQVAAAGQTTFVMSFAVGGERATKATFSFMTSGGTAGTVSGP